jgi:hypothetical protein
VRSIQAAAESGLSTRLSGGTQLTMAVTGSLILFERALQHA